MTRINVGKEKKAIRPGSILILNEPMNMKVKVEQICSSTMILVSYTFENQTLAQEIHISKILKIEE
jgi:hypothetical protein